MITLFGMYTGTSIYHFSHPSGRSVLCHRLLNIVHSDTKLYLVFEFLDMDLKRYMDAKTKRDEALEIPVVKVGAQHVVPIGENIP